MAAFASQPKRKDFRYLIQMAEKKGKALVMKLLDDLINDESPDQSVDQKKDKARGEASANEPTRVQSSASSPADSPLEVEISSVATIPVESTKTEPIGTNQTIKVPTTERSITAKGEAKAAVGRFGGLRTGGFSSATEAALATSENLRIAQNRILQLEEELARLRTENEQLAAAGETLRRRADDLLAQSTTLQGRLERITETKDQEIDLLRQSQRQRDNEVTGLRLKIEELEMRLSTNIQKIRVRERELENRLELVKMESTALVRNKDEIILDLKRQTDQLTLELENYRNKGQELNRQLDDKQEMLRRTVKALRIALSLLEGEDEAAATPQKKVK